jgi:hypothetical protein
MQQHVVRETGHVRGIPYIKLFENYKGCETFPVLHTLAVRLSHFNRVSKKFRITCSFQIT